MDTETLLTLILGGGAVGTIGALFQGIRSLQSGARKREKDTVKDLVNQRKEAWVDRDNALDQADYWRQWAGVVEYEAQRAGVQLPPKPPPPVPKVFDEDQT